MTTHKQKRKIAYHLNVVTRIDAKTGRKTTYHSNKNLFNNDNWDSRKKAIALRVKKTEEAAKERAAVRKAAKKTK